MAVYTEVGDAELQAFLKTYDLGALLSCKGIAEGVENSNFLLRTEAGNFILTLYEKRVAAADLPFFLGLMEHLAERGISCPLPVRDRGGRIAARARRPAGRARSPSSTGSGSAVRRRIIARRSARRWHEMHLAGADFALEASEHAVGGGLAQACRAIARARRHGRARPSRDRSTAS